ncbi:MULTISPECIES: TIGR04282 family arsenosugar biosynthesis glycosyltransferase [Mesonia]|uniref:2-phospho-L-lactate guanylyltransferase n=1 Tax=Mesonia oceanica TaxID=2687242 RepID=A0AC61Y7Z7_9FLAO|nr:MULTISPECIES: TIGR04282 family arsenosugar biosynthesis glycosyltransferase [Mesonia]MAN27599.1 glycosyltransferase [Mesonia sp.]MAQ40204.1 glycosyltransferase [Mesonia sp.]MBJ97115.1 glycosyltransferase [Flavobacteriaceae bacterium]VVV00631.1 2-phospho-L-lactate guanylyltransferase [Mesonia oceanica]|tara:strand:- start:14111 stop:14719 length:609 start_codon:yes stop_codon:yes gene_type:complete
MKNKNLLLIFTKNPELGKCKTRLAKSIGDEAALSIYKHLLQHTASVSHQVNSDKQVFYSKEIIQEDDFDSNLFQKKLQQGKDLGIRMSNAFAEAFQEGYQKVIIIGSDLYDLHSETIEEAFQNLDTHEVVIGPAKDGGYYLLGMKSFIPEIFQQKKWSTATVLQDTLADLKSKKVTLLATKNDIDTFEDIKGISVFQQYLKL